jgi:hypothetical protein
MSLGEGQELFRNRRVTQPIVEIIASRVLDAPLKTRKGGAKFLNYRGSKLIVKSIDETGAVDIWPSHMKGAKRDNSKNTPDLKKHLREYQFHLLYEVDFEEECIDMWVRSSLGLWKRSKWGKISKYEVMKITGKSPW